VIWQSQCHLLTPSGVASQPTYRGLTGSVASGRSALEMGSVGGIAAVQARIASIRSRLDISTTTVNGPTSIEVGAPTNPTAGFDPFGTAYQEAMTQAGIIGSADGSANADSGADATDDGTGSTTGSVPSSAAPVYGTGQIASFTPGELTGGAVAASSVSAYTPSNAAYPSATAPSASVASSVASSVAASAYGTAASLTSDVFSALDGPVYTGASKLPGYQYGAASPTTGTATIAFTGSSPVAAGVPGASIGKIGGYGQMPVPADLQAYGNGQLPDSALESIGQGGHRLYAPAAESWKSAVAAAAADGVTLRVTDSYRTYDQQTELASRKGLYADGGYAAVPGTSNHGWGLALDVDTSQPAAASWMRTNGWRFGFVEAVPREPWHWEYRPQQA